MNELIMELSPIKENCIESQVNALKNAYFSGYK